MAKLDDAGIFKSLLDQFSVPQFDETRYKEMLADLQPEHLTAFLRHMFGTRVVTNDFLVKALEIARQNKGEFDS